MDDDDLAALVIEDTRDKMHKAIDHLRSEMSNVRTGRASSALLEPLIIDYYGTPTVLRQLAGTNQQRWAAHVIAQQAPHLLTDVSASFPALAAAQLSTRGVALPRTNKPPSRRMRSRATGMAL